MLHVSDLKLSLRDSTHHQIEILRGLSFQVGRGEIVALVGESGSGKTLTGMSLCGLFPDNAITEGKVEFENEIVINGNSHNFDNVRGSKIALIFQDASASLNPLEKIMTQLGRVVKKNNPHIKRKERLNQCRNLLTKVELDDIDRILASVPFHLSGGQKQRIMIAMALAISPSFLIADEPTTALDKKNQLQVMGLLKHLASEESLGVLFITHDLSLVEKFADRMLIMYAGKIVESGKVSALIENPLHPYTEALYKCLPGRSQANSKKLDTIIGVVPSFDALDSGCDFRERCSYAKEICSKPVPLYNLSQDRAVACVN